MNDYVKDLPLNPHDFTLIHFPLHTNLTVNQEIVSYLYISSYIN